MRQNQQNKPHYKSDYKLKITPSKNNKQTLNDIVYSKEFVEIIHQLLLKYS